MRYEGFLFYFRLQKVYEAFQAVENYCFFVLKGYNDSGKSRLHGSIAQTFWFLPENPE